MSTVTCFTFNPFQENTYVISDDRKQSIIIDPGCYTKVEQQTLVRFISDNDLSVLAVLNTHCHIDHVFGNRFVCEEYKCGLWVHKGELSFLRSFPEVCQMYGLQGESSPDPVGFLVQGESFSLGQSVFDIVFTPGHSPASICLINKADSYVIAGDVLFSGSIGRTDLPGGDYDTLIESIRSELLVLDDSYIVYPGHGPSTKIGVERKTNPFLNS